MICTTYIDKQGALCVWNPLATNFIEIYSLFPVSGCVGMGPVVYNASKTPLGPGMSNVHSSIPTQAKKYAPFSFC
jgi:hypothetical protein